MQTIIQTLGNKEEFVRAAAEFIRDEAQAAITAKGRFHLVLSGGSTPKDIYRALALPEYSDQIDWNGVVCFFGDERRVPLDHMDSNFLMAWKTLLSRVPIPDENILPMPVELDPEQAAAEYEHALRLAPGQDSRPDLDLILLGLGADGHTASLFPDSPALSETKALVAAVDIPDMNPRVGRLTLTLPAMNHAAKVLFLAKEQGKEAALAGVLSGDRRFPASRVRAREQVVWMILQD
ncbi:MAG: 6-phosphogluconolactonase [Desulfovibrio sp.]|nr:MAG: 6-phosphogluconolactonase [Desulfovibrio sp.]